MTHGPQRAALATLLLGAMGAAHAVPSRFRTNPLRAHRARELAHRSLGPSQSPDGWPTEAAPNGDGGTVIDGYDFWWIGSNSPTALSLTNSGVLAVMQEVDAPPQDGGCFDCWTSEYLDNGFWGQVGFSVCTQTGTDPFISTFYQVWDANPTPEVLLVDGESELTSPGIHTYAMSLQSGTTWGFSVDGALLGIYDMGSATSSAPGAIATVCEEGDGVIAPYSPPAISVPVAMCLSNGATWEGASASEVYNSADLSGVVGNLQNSALPNDAILIGGQSAYAISGTPLWMGAAPGFPPDAGPAGLNALTPPLVTLLSPAANTTVSGVVVLSATAASVDGAAAITQITFSVEDASSSDTSQWTANGPPVPEEEPPELLVAFDQ